MIRNQMTMAELLALPPSVGMKDACRALGISASKGYELVKAGEFPLRVIRVGHSCKVPRSELFRELGVSGEDRPAALTAAAQA